MVRRAGAGAHASTAFPVARLERGPQPQSASPCWPPICPGANWPRSTATCWLRRPVTTSGSMGAVRAPPAAIGRDRAAEQLAAEGSALLVDLHPQRALAQLNLLDIETAQFRRSKRERRSGDRSPGDSWPPSPAGFVEEAQGVKRGRTAPCRKPVGGCRRHVGSGRRARRATSKATSSPQMQARTATAFTKSAPRLRCGVCSARNSGAGPRAPGWSGPGGIASTVGSRPGLAARATSVIGRQDRLWHRMAASPSTVASQRLKPMPRPCQFTRRVQRPRRRFSSGRGQRQRPLPIPAGWQAA